MKTTSAWCWLGKHNYRGAVRRDMELELRRLPLLVTNS
jgi:hypothetical protein